MAGKQHSDSVACSLMQCIGSAVSWMVLALDIITTAGVQSHAHASDTICTCT